MSSACSSTEMASVHLEKVQCSMTHQSYVSKQHEQTSLFPDPCKLGTLPDKASTALTERKKGRKLAETTLIYRGGNEVIEMGC